MKTFQEIRRKIISDISIGEMMGADKQYSFAKIEELAAKEYAKQWVSKALLESVITDATHLLVEMYDKEIDAQ